MKRQLGNRASLTLALGLESARNTAGVSKLHLANRIHCTPQHIARVEERRTNPAQALIAKVAAELEKTPADLYLLGEMKLEEHLVSMAKEKRRQVQAERGREAILQVLPDLGAEDLHAIATAAMKLAEAAESVKKEQPERE